MEVLQFFKSTIITNNWIWRFGQTPGNSTLYMSTIITKDHRLYEKDWTGNILYSLHHFQPPLSDKNAVDDTIGLYTEISKLFLSQKFEVIRDSLFNYRMPGIISCSSYEEPYLKVRLH